MVGTQQKFILFSSGLTTKEKYYFIISLFLNGISWATHLIGVCRYLIPFC